MKTIKLLALCTMLCTMANAQTDSVAAPVDTVTKQFTKENLSILKKVELTKIYLDQLTHMIDMLGKTSVKEGDVPKNKYTDNHWITLDKASKKHNDTILEKYMNIIPYSDTDNIIESILFFQDIIAQMNSI